MEVKTKAIVLSTVTITLFVHWIKFLSSMAQGNEDGKGLKLEKNEPKFLCLHGHDIFQKSPKFQVDSFYWQNSFDILFKCQVLIPASFYLVKTNVTELI